ncbi:MAG: hypothetical protein Q9196_007263 [Gyalolechia fulgens]
MAIRTGVSIQKLVSCFSAISNMLVCVPPYGTPFVVGLTYQRTSLTKAGQEYVARHWQKDVIDLGTLKQETSYGVAELRGHRQYGGMATTEHQLPYKDSHKTSYSIMSTNKNTNSAGIMSKNQNTSRGSTSSTTLPLNQNANVDPGKATALSETKTDDTSGGKPESKLSAKDRLLQKYKTGGSSGILSKLEKINLFDPTKASSIQTRGMSSLKSIAPAEDGMMISGRNVGAEQNEPDWSSEQLKFINEVSSITLIVQTVADNRRSVIDPEQKFVGRDVNGSIVPIEKA